MCGRFSLATAPEELVEVFDVPPLDFEVGPRFNVAPGQDALVVGEDRRGRRMGMLRWGLIPSWSKAPGTGFVNARGESVERTPSFRDAFLHRRCLVPADGFYEWRSDEGGESPFLFRPAVGGVLALAAVWERWEGPGHPPLNAFAVLTVAASADVAPVHHRMPVLVDPTRFSDWLDRATPLERVHELIAPAATGTLTFHPVSRRVNSVREDDAGLVEPV
ncbi:MAG: SOS response-associated peptidase [Longimicrobiales bacterium]|nr:SOS response-associated peptidase [Longimicrobiales bacterium]